MAVLNWIYLYSLHIWRTGTPQMNNENIRFDQNQNKINFNLFYPQSFTWTLFLQVTYNSLIC